MDHSICIFRHISLHRFYSHARILLQSLHLCKVEVFQNIFIFFPLVQRWVQTWNQFHTEKNRLGLVIVFSGNVACGFCLLYFSLYENYCIIYV